MWDLVQTILGYTALIGFGLTFLFMIPVVFLVILEKVEEAIEYFRRGMY